jgi:complement component 1 Q subcomponent-binding protein
VSDLDVPSDAELPIEGEVAGEDTDASPYITCSLVITKHAHPDAMSVDLEAGEDGFEVTNVAMFESAVAEAEGAEGDWQRRSKYMGPRECFGVSSWNRASEKSAGADSATEYEHLDAGVQEAFGAFLAERGVDDGLGKPVPQSADSIGATQLTTRSPIHHLVLRVQGAEGERNPQSNSISTR